MLRVSVEISGSKERELLELQEGYAKDWGVEICFRGGGSWWNKMDNFKADILQIKQLKKKCFLV